MGLCRISQHAAYPLSFRISCGGWTRTRRRKNTLLNVSPSRWGRNKWTRGESRLFCFFGWPADWLMMWVLAGDLLMGCLMRIDYTVWLSPSLHASHDNRVSVTPFNPITPTWSDTNSITPFLPSTRSSLFPWLPVTHSVTGGLYLFIFFIAWWAGSLKQALSLFLVSCLALKPRLFYLSSVSSLFRSEPLKTKRCFYSTEPLSWHWPAAEI